MIIRIYRWSCHALRRGECPRCYCALNPLTQSFFSLIQRSQPCFTYKYPYVSCTYITFVACGIYYLRYTDIMKILVLNAGRFLPWWIIYNNSSIVDPVLIDPDRILSLCLWFVYVSLLSSLKCSSIILRRRIVLHLLLSLLLVPLFVFCVSCSNWYPLFLSQWFWI